MPWVRQGRVWRKTSETDLTYPCTFTKLFEKRETLKNKKSGFEGERCEGEKDEDMKTIEFFKGCTILFFFFAFFFILPSVQGLASYSSCMVCFFFLVHSSKFVALYPVISHNNVEKKNDKKIKKKV